MPPSRRKRCWCTACNGSLQPRSTCISHEWTDLRAQAKSYPFSHHHNPYPYPRLSASDERGAWPSGANGVSDLQGARWQIPAVRQHDLETPLLDDFWSTSAAMPDGTHTGSSCQPSFLRTWAVAEAPTPDASSSVADNVIQTWPLSPPPFAPASSSLYASPADILSPETEAACLSGLETSRSSLGIAIHRESSLMFMLEREEGGLPLCDDDWEDDDAAYAVFEDSYSAPTLPEDVVASVEEAHAEDPRTTEDDHTDTPDLIATDAPVPSASNLDETFCSPPGPARTPFSLAHCSWHPAVLLVTLLCTFLHLVGHLPHRFVDVVVSIIGLIFCELGWDSLARALPKSLTGAMSSLHLDHIIHELPTCPACLRVHPESVCADRDALCSSCRTPLFAFPEGSSSHASKKARLRSPFKTITEQLASILAVPGNEDRVNAWKLLPRCFGHLRDIFDGAVCHRVRGPNDKPFFNYNPLETDGPDGELRIGLALGLDWFSYIRSLVAASYTSCPMSFMIVNFPPWLRFRANNLLLSGIIPGPKETNPDQTQYYLRVLVNELIRLWRVGAIIQTPRYPSGRRVRVILVGVFCDKPAAHKVGGFGSHAHTYFCTLDWITKAALATVDAFVRNAFRPRTNEEHRAKMAEYLSQRTKTARDNFVKTHGTRWSELSRLPYFDMCEMIVIDPMHNLFLGLVKAHFYLIWVQLKILRKQDLRTLHNMLRTFIAPSKLGRLPRLVGEPAGGSLTSDQWMLLATIIAPLLLPQLWESCKPDPDGVRLAERRQRIVSLLEKKKRSKQDATLREPVASSERAGGLSTGKQPAKKTRRRVRTRKTDETSQQAPTRRSSRPVTHTERWMNMDLESDDDGAVEIPDDEVFQSDDEEDSEDEGNTSTTSMHPRDLTNFLKLSYALRILLAEDLTFSDVAEADRLLREYCIELLELYGPGVIKPNHHYATHTGDFVLNYGPLREFWTFVFERLNKILKSFKTNNHDGGELECTFLREFHRTAELSRLLAEGLRDAPADSVREACTEMVQASTDIRGTVQQFTRDIEDTYTDGGVSLQLSPRASRGTMDLELYWDFVRFLRRTRPRQLYHTVLEPHPAAGSMLVHDTGTFFDYVVVSGHRYAVAGNSSSNAARRDSLALVRTAGPSGAARTWVAEVNQVMSTDSPALLFASVKWLKPVCPESIMRTPWGPFANDFDLRLWHLGSYLQPPDPGPAGSLIEVGDIVCPVVRHPVTVDGMELWLTLPIRTIPPPFFSSSDISDHAA